MFTVNFGSATMKWTYTQANYLGSTKDFQSHFTYYYITSLTDRAW